MPVPRRILAVASSAASVFALAASAHAATVSTLPCVRTANGVGTVPIAGTGFTPGASVSLRSDPPGVFTSAVTDAAGNFATTSSAPSFNPFARQLQTFALLAADGTNPALVAATTFKQVRVGYTTNPSTGRPTRKPPSDFRSPRLRAGLARELRSNPAGVFTSATVDPAGNFVAHPAPRASTRSRGSCRRSTSSPRTPPTRRSSRDDSSRSASATRRTPPPAARAGDAHRPRVPAGRNIYLHFRFQGQTKRNVKVGRADSPCGVASKRMALLPTRSRPGQWTVYADQAATYSKTTTPQLKYTFTITRTFG